MKTVSEIGLLTPETCLMFNYVTEVGFASVFVPNQLVTGILVVLERDDRDFLLTFVPYLTFLR